MLKQRIITAVILAAFVLWALFTWPAEYFGVFLLFCTAACAWEWTRLGNVRALPWRVAYTVIVTAVVAGLVFPGLALLKIIVPLALLVWLMITIDLARRSVISLENDSPDWFLLVLAAFLLAAAVASLYLALVERSALYVVYIIVVVAAADIGAYFSGKRFGRRKLAVSISQGKTIEGAIGGMAAAGALALLVTLFARFFAENSYVDSAFSGLGSGFLAVSFMAALLSIVGDLFISRAKRTVGVKDSGKLLPGHGGVLDRFDGLLAAAPWLAIPLLWSF